MPTTGLNIATRVAVFVRDGHACQYCGEPAVVPEHVIPEAIGGCHAAYNIVAACVSCNVKKARWVWIPRNIETLRAENADWADRIIAESCFDARSGCPIPARKLTKPVVPPSVWTAARKAFGETMPAFAARLGVTRQYVSLIESGKRQPHLLGLVRLCEVLTSSSGWSDERLAILEQVFAAHEPLRDDFADILRTKGTGSTDRAAILRRVKETEGE